MCDIFYNIDDGFCVLAGGLRAPGGFRGAVIPDKVLQTGIRLTDTAVNPDVYS